MLRRGAPRDRSLSGRRISPSRLSNDLQSSRSGAFPELGGEVIREAGKNPCLGSQRFSDKRAVGPLPKLGRDVGREGQHIRDSRSSQSFRGGTFPGFESEEQAARIHVVACECSSSQSVLVLGLEAMGRRMSPRTRESNLRTPLSTAWLYLCRADRGDYRKGAQFKTAGRATDLPSVGQR